MNRVTLITYPTSPATTVQFHYDWRGRRDYVIDQNGNKTSYGYDDADRVITITDAQSPTPGITTYGYDTENNLTDITDAMGNHTHINYTGNGPNPLNATFPSGYTESYEYNGDNQIVRKTDRNGNVFAYWYDYQSRLIDRSYPDTGGEIQYFFDPASRLTEVEDERNSSRATYTFGYDNMARLTSAETAYTFDSDAPTYTINYGYDANSNRTSMTDPQGLITSYGYDAVNRIDTLAFNGQNPGYTFGYDTVNRRTSLTRPNSVDTAYTYDPVSRLLSVLHKLGTTVLDGASYSYDGAGNRQARTDKRTNTTLTYGYDNIYQLLTAKQGSTTKESYTYDLVGNRLSSLGISPYDYNSSNELTSLPSGSYSYDKNGNTLTKPDGTQYTWDINNELTEVALPGTGGTVNFLYDPFGRRIQKSFTQSGTTTTTDYLYDGSSRIEDLLDGNGTQQMTARYVGTLSIDEPLQEIVSGTTSYYEQDGLGSVTSLSNSAGALVNTYSYDSFGKLLASTGTTPNPFLYTGRELDVETGEYFFRARYYDQNVGRFISEDPIQFDGGINFYAYVGNNATTLTDSTGTAFKTCAKALADLANASSRLGFRLGEIQFHGGNPDPEHLKQLQIAVDNVRDALQQVEKYCGCNKDQALAAAEIGIALGLLAEAAPYLAEAF